MSRRGLPLLSTSCLGRAGCRAPCALPHSGRNFPRLLSFSILCLATHHPLPLAFVKLILNSNVCVKPPFHPLIVLARRPILLSCPWSNGPAHLVNAGGLPKRNSRQICPVVGPRAPLPGPPGLSSSRCWLNAANRHHTWYQRPLASVTW